MHFFTLLRHNDYGSRNTATPRTRRRLWCVVHGDTVWNAPKEPSWLLQFPIQACPVRLQGERYSIFQDTLHHKGGKLESYYRGQVGPSIGLGEGGSDWSRALVQWTRALQHTMIETLQALAAFEVIRP